MPHDIVFERYILTMLSFFLQAAGVIYFKVGFKKTVDFSHLTFPFAIPLTCLVFCIPLLPIKMS